MRPLNTRPAAAAAQTTRPSLLVQVLSLALSPLLYAVSVPASAASWALRQASGGLQLPLRALVGGLQLADSLIAELLALLTAQPAPKVQLTSYEKSVAALQQSNAAAQRQILVRGAAAAAAAASLPCCSSSVAFARVRVRASSWHREIPLLPALCCSVRLQVLQHELDGLKLERSKAARRNIEVRVQGCCLALQGRCCCMLLQHSHGCCGGSYVAAPAVDLNLNACTGCPARTCCPCPRSSPTSCSSCSSGSARQRRTRRQAASSSKAGRSSS